ncbi:MAG: aminotransferase class III-fold pyridoxal phosphate-dependent enzyme [Actinomycetota bacterium]
MPYRDPHPIDGATAQQLWERADRALPGGGVYLTRSADLAGRGVLPGFIAAASGAHVTDVDGRRYIDYLGANGPNILGYRHPEVEAAAERVRASITTASIFPPQLVEVVERLLATWTDMHWGVVAKNGSEVVSLGARVARQHTGRTQVVAFTHAYHGNDPELAARPPAGPLTDLTSDVMRIPWNDAQQLADTLTARGDDIAAILLNPIDQRPLVRTTSASDDVLAVIRAARERFGTLLVFDDVRHGLRMHPQGTHRLLGLEPDLIALGKALGNGYAISAVLGAEELRTAARQIMFTSTYMFEVPPMVAAMTTLDVYERDDVFDRITLAGTRLRDGLLQAAETAGHDISISGPVTMPTLLFHNDPEAMRVRTFARAAAEHGAILHPLLNWNLSAAHTIDVIDATIDIAATAFEAVET